MAALGRHVFGLAAIAIGAVGFWWGAFDKPWQPVPDDLPHLKALAYATAALFVLIGVGLQWPRTAGMSALGAAALFVVFTALWAKRIAGHPQIFGTWSGTAEELALVLGALTVFAALRNAGTMILICRILFGVCLLAFGAAHFLYVKETAELVPAWLPPNPNVWAYITGAAHVGGGLALISGVMALLAARLVTAMFVGFGLLVWLPQLFSAPSAHISWGGNAINLALIGAIWVVADAIAAKKQA